MMTRLAVSPLEIVRFRYFTRSFSRNRRGTELEIAFAARVEVFSSIGATVDEHVQNLNVCQIIFRDIKFA